MKLNEFYVKDTNGLETDLIEYDEFGDIENWLVWSEALEDWAFVPLSQIQKQHPFVFKKISDQIKDLVGDLSEYETQREEQARVDLALGK